MRHRSLYRPSEALARLSNGKPRPLRAVAGASIAPPPNLREMVEIVPPHTSWIHSGRSGTLVARVGMRLEWEFGHGAKILKNANLRLHGLVISTASARRRCRNRGSTADSHPANPPATAVPETLVHPFATAKIVVWPATCSVRGGLIIAARSRDATLRACRRHGERTSDRCDRDEGSKCLLHSRPSCA